MDTNWDNDNFIEDNDFRLWKLKMQAVLIQQKYAKALRDEYALPATMSQANNTEMVDRAKNVIVLYLVDIFFREFAKETTTVMTWSKLESLYITKLLAHKQFLKQQLYSFWMVESIIITKQLMELNKFFDDLINIEVNIEDEVYALFLL